MVDERALAELERLRVEAIATGDQAFAKATWCLTTTIEIQQNYVSAFAAMREGRFYDAWCTLEKVEIALLGLEHHNALDEEFALPFIDRHVEQFQKLYPYSIFLSPAFLEREVRCSICNAKLSIRSGCDHVVGDIYDGKKCLRIVTAEPIETSFVTDPVQKYSVPFFVDQKTGKSSDHYDYSFVSYVVQRLRSPFDAWSMIRTTRRHPHKRYKHVGRNAKCPCESGKKYKSCCLHEEGVLRPHIDIEFAVRPPKALPVVYSRNV